MSSNTVERRGGYFRWQRGTVAPLGRYFSTREFTCKCGSCKSQTVSIEMIERLDQIRDELGEPIVVTSGYRCNAYQNLLRGSGFQTSTGISTHEKGEAADIRAVDNDALRDLCFKYFKAVGTANTFTHVDMRSDKVRRWQYL